MINEDQVEQLTIVGIIERDIKCVIEVKREYDVLKPFYVIQIIWERPLISF